MSSLLIVWVFLCSVFVSVPGVYYLYMKRAGSRPWNLKIDKSYTPLTTILIPTYNEERSIRLKLENLWKVKFSKEKIQVILVDDCSRDKTLEEVYNFLNYHSALDITVLSRTERSGKSKALNLALKYAKGDIIIVSDADCFWSPDILLKALPYLSDPSVGAVTGLEVLLNPRQSWVTRTEVAYNDSVHEIRTGESKIHSTIFFQGGFGAYRRAVLDEFDHEADDSGTALNIVQKGFRTLLIPEAIYFTTFPSGWKGKIIVKARRASQLIKIWVKCLKLALKGQLALPKRTSLPEAFLYVFNPIIFLLLMGITLLLPLEQPVLFWVFPIILLPILLLEKSRTLFIEVIQDNCILLGALFLFILSKKSAIWKTAEQCRSCLTRDVLERKGLI